MHIKYALDGYREHFKKHPLQKVPRMTEEQIKYMRDRFLFWRLPADFHPDDGISFDPIMNKGHTFEKRREPVGTNLFSADQAKAMVEYMTEGMGGFLDVGEEVSGGRLKELWKECGGCVDRKKGRFWIEPEHAPELIRKIITAITTIANKPR